MPPKAKEEKGRPLTFVVTTNPFDGSTAANKKRVRSVAALTSWPKRRKKLAEAEAEPTSGPSTIENVRSKRRQPRIEPASSTPIQSELQTVTPGLSPQNLSIPAPTASGFEKPCTKATTINQPCACSECCREVSIIERKPVSIVRNSSSTSGSPADQTNDLLTPPPTPLVHSAASDLADPFDCYPVPRKPWFDHVLHHMLTVFAPRGWPALKITKKEGLHWEWFMTQHALSEPALFYVRLLFATGDMIRLGVLDSNASYWLQHQAVKAINEALSDPKRATSDPLILAVGRIALHESMYGNRQAANVIHRPAQQRMIAMRGGMRALEFPELVKRLMRWSDRVMAMQGGTERLLEDDDTTQDFTIKQSVNVSENWFGKDGRELRQKIKISDLINEGDG